MVIDSGILQWMAKYKMRHSRGEPFEWKRHSFLMLPMSDWSQKIAIKKSAQVGFSESFAMKAIYAAFNYKYNVIYTLPTDRFAETFVSTKVEPIIDVNPDLQRGIKGSKSYKEIANRFIYFRGTFNSKNQADKAENEKAISITSDLNIHDERDRSDHATIEQYESRLENSTYGGIWNFSNPTYPFTGTDALYEESDQKMWYVKCSHCGHRQYLDWVKLGEAHGVQDHTYIDVENQRFVCGKCQKTITDADRMLGEWVATYPDREISGYWMSQMNYVQHNVESLLEKEKKSKQVFYNFVLGKAYRGTDVVVTRQSIVQNIVHTTNQKTDVTMGVDNGIWKHYVIGNHTGIFRVGKTKDWQEIEQLINEYNAITVIDGNPHPAEPIRLSQKYKGRVFTAFYKKDRDMIDSYEFRRKDNRGIVYIQRTRYFDILVDKFRNKEKNINLLERDLEEFIRHWETMSRQEVKDSMGIIKGEWISSNKIDHYAHATLYQDVAMQRTLKTNNAIVSNNLIMPERKAIVAETAYGAPTIADIKKAITQGNSNDWRYL